MRKALTISLLFLTMWITTTSMTQKTIVPVVDKTLTGVYDHL